MAPACWVRKSCKYRLSKYTLQTQMHMIFLCLELFVSVVLIGSANSLAAGKQCPKAAGGTTGLCTLGVSAVPPSLSLLLPRWTPQVLLTLFSLGHSLDTALFPVYQDTLGVL